MPAALRPLGTPSPGVPGGAGREGGQRSGVRAAAAMPVWLREHSWRQTLTAVYLSLPLRGARATPASIFCSERYLKVGGPLASRASCRAGPRPRGCSVTLLKSTRALRRGNASSSSYLLYPLSFMISLCVPQAVKRPSCGR